MHQTCIVRVAIISGFLWTHQGGMQSPLLLGTAAAVCAGSLGGPDKFLLQQNHLTFLSESPPLPLRALLAIPVHTHLMHREREREKVGRLQMYVQTHRCMCRRIQRAYVFTINLIDAAN